MTTRKENLNRDLYGFLKSHGFKPKGYLSSGESSGIPEKADFIFLGGSLYECGGIKPSMYIEEYNNEFYRVYYMLSLHTTIVPNINSANILLDFLKSRIKYGISEFLSVVYNGYTMAALLNLVDFCKNEEIKNRLFILENGYNK